MLSLTTPRPLAPAPVAEESVLANFTSSARPRTSLPCMFAIAEAACATSANFTNPNPRLLFVETSRMTQQLATAPKRRTPP